MMIQTTETKQTNNHVQNITTVKLEGDNDLVITRRFNASARLVFDAWTQADLVRRWWAPKSHGVSIAACDADVKVGGRYRYVLKKNDDGNVFAFSGRYLELQPSSRLVYTQV